MVKPLRLSPLYTANLNTHTTLIHGSSVRPAQKDPVSDLGKLGPVQNRHK